MAHVFTILTLAVSFPNGYCTSFHKLLGADTEKKDGQVYIGVA